MISFSSVGSFKKTLGSLEKLQGANLFAALGRYGQVGANALAKSTPRDDGDTANAWTYEIQQTKQGVTIHWVNNHVNAGVNIAVIIQYGHGTGTGGWVEGRDYINPAMRPIFDQILNDVWKVVTNA